MCFITKYSRNKLVYRHTSLIFALLIFQLSDCITENDMHSKMMEKKSQFVCGRELEIAALVNYVQGNSEPMLTQVEQPEGYFLFIHCKMFELLLNMCSDCAYYGKAEYSVCCVVVGDEVKYIAEGMHLTQHCN
jgi:hypothetical protein